MTIATAADVGNSSSSFISSAQAAATTAINTLNTAAASWSAANWSSIGTPSSGTYTQFTETDTAISTALAALETAVSGNYTGFADTDSAIATALTTLETAISGSYTGFADTDSTIATALAAFSTTLASITPAALPSAPGMSGYTSPVWSDTFWTNLKGILGTFTANITGADDVDSVVTKLSSETTKLQVALYAEDRERRAQTLRDAHSAAASATGSKGFSHPNSMTTALKLAATQTFMFGCSQSSRDLVKEIFAWAKSNYQFTIQQQLSAHQADTDFNLRYAGVLIQVYSEQVRNILQEYRDRVAGEISKAEQKIKSYSLRLDVTKSNAEISESADRTKLAKLEGKLKEYAQRLEVVRVNAAISEAVDRTKLAKLEGKLKEYGLRLEVVKGNAGIVEAHDRISSANFAVEVQQHATNVSQAVETAARNARNRIDAAVAAVNSAAQMAQAASQISIGVLNG